MRELFESIRRWRDVDLPILICGETGTGKELVARAVHAASTRRHGPFHSIHCASLPTELFESELFGYEAGAFTGAEESRPGLLEHLDGGTLLLDEITLLPPATQAKLLQVLDRKTIRPLGSLDARSVDVRFLASTSSSPDDAVQRGDLSDELFFRLRSLTLPVPPLRARQDDIPLLFGHFLALHARRLERELPSVSEAAEDLLRRHGWPGNVRELETLAIRLIVDSRPGDLVGVDGVRRLLGPRTRAGLFGDDLLEGRTLDELRTELERAYLEKLFLDSGGDVRRVLEHLGIRRSNLYTRFRKLGIDVRELRQRMRDGRGNDG